METTESWGIDITSLKSCLRCSRKCHQVSLAVSLLGRPSAQQVSGCSLKQVSMCRAVWRHYRIIRQTVSSSVGSDLLINGGAIIAKIILTC